MIIYAITTANYIVLYKYLATRFNQLHDNSQTVRTLNNKITIVNFILGQNEITA